MNRNKQYYREMREKHIKRKKKIDSYSYTYNEYPMYSCDGKYSKGKVHCSCGVCRRKTNNKSWRKRTIHGNYAPNHDWKASDLRQIQKMDYKETNDILVNPYDEDDFEWETANVEDVSVNGVSLDGSYFDKMFDF